MRVPLGPKIQIFDQTGLKYSMGKQICPWPRNMLLTKNPQFLLNHYETHEFLILIEFRNDWVKIFY